ncbi:Indoleamine 2,3-dioxygenase [Peniophora sp. CONT]|nr:Indoleamine 2,3-dioxygenase [Peniophora sp. CONT]
MQPLRNSLRQLSGQPTRDRVLPLREYDIDPVLGFFPPAALSRLGGDHAIWEAALDNAKGKLSLGEDTRAEAKAKRAYGETWRARVRTMPVLVVGALGQNLRASQRAHMVLAFLIHFYVHSQIPSPDRWHLVVPASLAVPMVAISRILGIAPVLTLADTVMWNAQPLDPSRPFSASNVRFAHLFSGTETEQQFYIASIKPELIGVDILHAFEQYHSLLNPADPVCVSKTAREIVGVARTIDRITQVMGEIKATLNPYQFYWEVRPWFSGSGPAGDPSTRWVYEGVAESSQLDLAGPSAGQSTVMHALDVFFEVDHKQVQHRPTPQTEANKAADKGFMERMWRYMPGDHRRYLEDLRRSQTPIRGLAEKSPLLREAYDNAVQALKEFRSSHIQVATLFIISQARTTPPGTPDEAAERAQFAVQGASKGTGGMALATQLKSGRDSTARTLLGST